MDAGTCPVMQINGMESGRASREMAVTRLKSRARPAPTTRPNPETAGFTLVRAILRNKPRALFVARQNLAICVL